MLEPDSGIGSVRVVVVRREVPLLSNLALGAWITWTRNLGCGTISRCWTKNSLLGFCSGECPLACGPMRWTPQNPRPKYSRTFSRENEKYDARVPIGPEVRRIRKTADSRMSVRVITR